jgi:hypothetical protein
MDPSLNQAVLTYQLHKNISSLIGKNLKGGLNIG